MKIHSGNAGGEPYRPPNCRLCWLWLNDTRWKAAHPEGPHAGGVPEVLRPLPCCYLGDPLPRQPGEPCGTRLRHCEVYETCTTQRCPRADHWCFDPATGQCCPSYVAADLESNASPG